MKDKIDRNIYGDHWLFFHIIISIIISVFLLVIMKLCNVQWERLFSLINENTISLSATIAGFVFTGMSIFISMNGTKKMKTIKYIGKDNIIYGILMLSIFFFVISLLMMLVDIYIFSFNLIAMIEKQKVIKIIIEIISVYTFLLGFVFFFSSLKLIYWMFK